MYLFNLVAQCVIAFIVLAGLAALGWTLAAAALLTLRSLGSRLPAWASWHPMAAMYNPKTDEHVHKPTLAQVLVACVASLFAAPVLMALGLLWMRNWLRDRRAAATPPQP